MLQWFLKFRRESIAQCDLKHGLSMVRVVLPCSLQQILFNAWHDVSLCLSLYNLNTVTANTFKEIFHKLKLPEEVVRTCTSLNRMLFTPCPMLIQFCKAFTLIYQLQ